MGWIQYVRFECAAHKCGWKCTEMNYTIKCTSHTKDDRSRLAVAPTRGWNLLLLLLQRFAYDALFAAAAIRNECASISVSNSMGKVRASARALAPVFIDGRLTWTRFCDAWINAFEWHVRRFSLLRCANAATSFLKTTTNTKDDELRTHAFSFFRFRHSTCERIRIRLRAFALKRYAEGRVESKRINHRTQCVRVRRGRSKRLTVQRPIYYIGEMPISHLRPVFCWNNAHQFEND